MSEESSTDAPVTPSPRWVSRLRRTSRRFRLGAAAVAVVVAAGVIATVALVAIPSSSPKSAYSTVPPPCAVVSTATLARYLPHPTGISQILPTNVAYQALNHAYESSTCKWSSTGSGEDRTLVVTAITYGLASGVTEAELAYNASVASLGCRCRAVSVSTRPVTGLGDQAEGFFINPSLGASVATAPNASSPGANLIVRSSNAGIYLDYATTAAATGIVLPPAESAAQLEWMASVARGILASLARPQAIPTAFTPGSAPFPPLSNEPQYTAPRDACLLITPATLAKYEPGASVIRIPSQSAHGVRQRECSWGSTNQLVLLTLLIFPSSDSNDAFLQYLGDAGTFGKTDKLVRVTGSAWMPDLGEDGLAIFQTQPGTGQGAQLFVWSGNVEINLWLNYSGPPVPGHTGLLMAGVSMVRDILAALAGPAASS